MVTMRDHISKESLPENFLPGDLVEVRSETEILATLDENGTFEDLPFMPEMLKFCGRTFRVSRQAFKTCVDDKEMRQLDNCVFLEEVRCDGGNHGGCDRACLIFWKQAWLKPSGSISPSNGFHLLKVNQSDLVAIAGRNGQVFCQSTEIVKASRPLPWWEPKQYLWDLKYNRISFIKFVESLLIAVYNKLAHFGRFKSWRFVAGPGQANSQEQPLNLQPGEMVRVKSVAEIKATLDIDGKHHSLLFAPTMLSFCGQVLRVQKRVENIVLEGTSRQRKIKDTVLLEGATCDGVCHRLCPRQSFLFWRECWLERV